MRPLAAPRYRARMDRETPPHIPRSFAESALNIRPGEGRRTALLFLFLLLASALFILGRTVRDTLFLSRYPLSSLPWMFVFYGVASAITAVAYGRLADRLARHQMLGLWTAIGIATYLATWALIRAGQSWVYPVFYVWSEVVANLFLVQFWTLANDLHDPRAAKRLFGTIGSARVLGVVLVGALAGAAVHAIGTAQLLFVLCALMAGQAALAWTLQREPRAGPSGAPRVRSGRSAFREDPYVRTLAAFLFLTFVALTLGDYQFKAIARARWQEDDLARFFSLFYAGTGLISFVFQVAVTPRLLARWGVSWGMAIMPVVFGAASAALWLRPSVVFAAAMKFADNGLQYTIHETTLQALYVPFPPQRKARTRAFLDAVVKPLAYGAGGLLLVLLAGRMEVQQLSAVTLPAVALWLLLIPRVRRRYLASLQSTLGARGALALGEEPMLDTHGRRALLEALEHGDPRHALVALEQLARNRSPVLARIVARLAAHPDPELRAAALERLGSLPSVPADLARAALADPDDGVRAAAVRAFSRLAPDAAVDALTPLLEDRASTVRVAALAGLLARGGVEGGAVGGTRIAAWQSSPRREVRVEAALALADLGPTACAPLGRLLADADPSVRAAAVRSARRVHDPRLVPPLLAALDDPAVRRDAGAALVACGTAAVRPLLDRLADPATPRPLRLLLPRFLREIPDSRAYEGLRDLLATEDSHLRLRLYGALSRQRRALELPPESVDRIAPLLRQETAEALHNLAGWERAKPLYDAPLLAEEIALRQDRAVRRVLRILELRYPRGPLGVVRTCLDARTHRANALEVIDTLLDPDLRPLVMAFFDDRPAEARFAAAGAGDAPVPGPDEFMRRQCAHSNPYVAFAALDALGRRAAGTPLCVQEAIDGLAHEDPLVREGAILALAHGAEGTAGIALEAHENDPDPMVARHARTARARILHGRTPEVSMYSTAEKILFLKGASIFARVTGEDLAPLARLAEVVQYGSGEVIFPLGEMGDTLYVIVRGRVAIERAGKRLSTLGPGEAFGEMGVLDAAPRSAAARADDETEVLRIGSEEFYEVLHEQAEIAEGIIRMLTRRLREATERAGTTA